MMSDVLTRHQVSFNSCFYKVILKSFNITGTWYWLNLYQDVTHHQRDRTLPGFHFKIILTLFQTSWGYTELLGWNLYIICFVNNFVRCFLQLLVFLAPTPQGGRDRGKKLLLFYPCGSAEPFCQISLILVQQFWRLKIWHPDTLWILLL